MENIRKYTKVISLYLDCKFLLICCCFIFLAYQTKLLQQVQLILMKTSLTFSYWAVTTWFGFVVFSLATTPGTIAAGFSP